MNGCRTAWDQQKEDVRAMRENPNTRKEILNGGEGPGSNYVRIGGGNQWGIKRRQMDGTEQVSRRELAS